MTQPEITIQGTPIPCTDEKLAIGRLLFLRENPRVLSSITGIPDFDAKFPEEQQEIIYHKLLKEPSVKKLIPDIRANGGLIEPILVRADTMEVIEGNSRLAAYRKLDSSTQSNKWCSIPCRIVSGLSDDQLATLLHSIHVKGKTSWTRYEKAYFTYHQHKVKGRSIKDVAEIFSVSEGTAYRDVRLIQAMKDNRDSERKNFSYYQVLEATPVIKRELNQNPQLKSVLLQMIRSPDHGSMLTAPNLRDQLPIVIKKPKILRKFVSGRIDLEAAYYSAKISNTQTKLQKVREILKDVTSAEVEALDPASQKAVAYECRKIDKETSRISRALEAMKSQ